MNKLRKMFEGDYETKTPKKFANSKNYLAVSIIGCLFCLISFNIPDWSNNCWLRDFSYWIISMRELRN